MDTGKKFALGGTVVLLVAVGIRVGLIYSERHEAAKPAAAVEGKMDPDDLVFLKQMRPDSLKDVKDLIGKTLWVNAGGQMDYYNYAAHKADYAHSEGLLLGDEQLIVVDAFEQAAPKNATFRIPGGDKQVLLAFTLPGSADPAKLYAVPVGYREGTTYTFSMDQIFFYDDPHQLYKHWTPEQWAAIDTHQAILGMNERQVELLPGAGQPQRQSGVRQSHGDFRPPGPSGRRDIRQQ